MAQQPSYDLEGVRAEFPVLRQKHQSGHPLVFLDNGASSQKPLPVLQAMQRYYETTHANVHRGIYQLSEQATALYEDARRKVRAFINAGSRREIIFTRGTTESMNLVAQTWGRANLGAGDVMLSTVMEHHANIVPWQMLAAEKGFSIRYVPVLPDGQLDADTYARWLKELPVKLVTMTHASNVLATINPIAEMAALAHEAGAVFMADGAQSVPHMPVDVQALGVDFYAFSGHKMCGPTGIGVLYGRRELLEAMPPYQGGGDMIATVTLEGSTWNELPYKFEAGTPSIAEAVGLAAAVDYLTALGMASVHAHSQSIADYARERLSELPFVTLYGHAPERGALVAFTVDGIHAHDVAQLLDRQGIAVRAGHHCAMPLHQHLQVAATTRASFYLYNTHEEVDALCRALYSARQAFVR
jgi:cysteine desulfurase/selenocysteine lyase